MAQTAVYVQVIGESQPTYGVIAFKAITLVDKTTHAAALKETEITSADFPSAPGRQADLLMVLKKKFPDHAPPLSLDLLKTSLAVNQLPFRKQEVNNAPPKIIFSDQPAILVAIDGPPAYRPVPGTELERVINTHALLLKDRAGRFYLHVLDSYMEAPALDGPWKITGQSPAGAAIAEKLAQTSSRPDNPIWKPAKFLRCNPPPRRLFTPPRRQRNLSRLTAGLTLSRLSARISCTRLTRPVMFSSC
jgi:hypothetical protein